MAAKYRWIHECEKPKMSRTLSREVEYRTWYGAKRTYIEHYEVWEDRNIIWTCTCGAEWEWRPMDNGGFWWCISRPKIWKDIEL